MKSGVSHPSRCNHGVGPIACFVHTHVDSSTCGVDLGRQMQYVEHTVQSDIRALTPSPQAKLSLSYVQYIQHSFHFTHVAHNAVRTVRTRSCSAARTVSPITPALAPAPLVACTISNNQYGRLRTYVQYSIVRTTSCVYCTYTVLKLRTVGVSRKCSANFFNCWSLPSHADNVFGL